MKGEFNPSRKRIVITDYNPCWAADFTGLRDCLWPHVADVATAIEHVGSTSIVGLAAKPIIDMDVIVADEIALAKAIVALSAIGYIHRGELGVRGRHAFLQPEPMPRHHLYVCLRGSLGLRNHIAFRDYLRTHPDAVTAYADLKRQLARKHVDDMAAYIEGKTQFIVGILAKQGFADGDIAEMIESNEA